MKIVFWMALAVLPAVALSYAIFPLVYGHPVSMSPSQTVAGQLFTLTLWVLGAGVVLGFVLLRNRLRK